MRLMFLLAALFADAFGDCTRVQFEDAAAEEWAGVFGRGGGSAERAALVNDGPYAFVVAGRSGRLRRNQSWPFSSTHSHGHRDGVPNGYRYHACPMEQNPRRSHGR